MSASGGWSPSFAVPPPSQTLALNHAPGSATFSFRIDSARRAVECGEEPIAHRLDLAPTVAFELGADQFIVTRHQLAPAGIAKLRRPEYRALSARSGSEPRA
jgi:hypothetical protein